mgnify:FL=1
MRKKTSHVGNKTDGTGKKLGPRAGVVIGETRIELFSILSKSVGPRMTLAFAVIRPELTAHPRLWLLVASFRIWVFLNATLGSPLASVGTFWADDDAFVLP